MSDFEFDALFEVLAAWPEARAPSAPTADGVFERVRQILQSSTRVAVQRSDLMALLAHVLRRQSRRSGVLARLTVPATDGWPSRDEWRVVGVNAHSEVAGRVIVEAKPWAPLWLEPVDCPVFEDVFGEREMRANTRRQIDPFVGEATGFAEYVSPGQREAVRSALLMAQGETLIVTLPTGSGKSLIAQAPVLVRGLEGPLTICVTPTTALVLDQARQMSHLMENRWPGVRPPPMAWHAGLSPEERDSIKLAIRTGRQGILYCSPEAMTRALLPALYSAARAGLIGYLVVDEAHLVSHWGDGFRPAFQLLAGVRRGLLDEAPAPGFRTILKSATLTPEAIQTLDALFGPNAQMVASVQLRPEIQYWVHRENDPASKERKVLELVRHAPRPFILYTTTRADAAKWFRTLGREGLKRIAQFDGETRDSERLRIIAAWAANEIDGIVATSAFGVGIDKADVRTVIHAAVPETLDRFYQEIGRGGRDGRASASFLIYSDNDKATADRMAAPSLISDELGFGRWSSMFQRAQRLDDLGALLRLDLGVVPFNLDRQTDYNEAWNMRTIIMMARAHVLELRSAAPESLTPIEGEAQAEFDVRLEEYWERYFKQIDVSVLEPGHRDPARFEALVRVERERALRAAQAGGALLGELLSGRTEVANLLEQLYRNNEAGRAVIVSKACGGCHAERRAPATAPEWSEPAVSTIERVTSVDLAAWKSTFPHLSGFSNVVMPLPERIEPRTIEAIVEALVSLFGVRELALAAETPLKPAFAQKLHKHARDGVLIVQDVDEERRIQSRYQLVRASVIGANWPEHLSSLVRPLHIVLAPASTPDPLHPKRRLGETGANVVTVEQFLTAVRA